LANRRSVRIAGCLLALWLAGASIGASAQAPVCPSPVSGRIFDVGFELPGGADLSAPGPFAIASVAGSSAQGGRTTPWVAHYPQSPDARPLVIFAPGLQIPSSGYRDWAEHLATWGYIAVRTDPAGGFQPDHVAMSLDLRDVLDDLVAPAALPVAVDASRIALSGHGLGGKVALIAAAGDARVRAIYAFDPLNAPGFNGYTPETPNIVPQPVAALAVPIGIVGELLDSTVGTGQACAPAATNYQTIFQAASASPRAFEWSVAGASHIDFVTNPDQCGLSCSFCQPRMLPLAQTHAFMRASTVAFLRSYLQGESGLCPWLTGTLVPGAVTVRQTPAP
jgi:predicted dienelactone hydrolase